MPYWRLSGFYFFYFASLGAFIPYWSVYLQSIDISPLEIGQLIAVVMATKIISPNIWGWIADHTRNRMSIVRLGCFFTTVCYFGVFVSDQFWWLALVMFAYSFFWNAALPQFEATTLSHLQDQSHRYSSIRLWGSIGFIASVFLLGLFLDRVGIEKLPIIVLFLLVCIWIMSLVVAESDAEQPHTDPLSLWQILKKPTVGSILVVCFLMQISHGPYYTFYTLYMKLHGYEQSVIGVFWAVGVIAEVAVFVVMHKLVPVFGLRTLLLMSLALTTLRWLLIASFINLFAVAVAAQILHAASFGIFHAVAIQLVYTYFKGKHHGKGQALYSSLSFGAGGAVGSMYSGYVWDSSPALMYYIAAAISAAALCITWFQVRLHGMEHR